MSRISNTVAIPAGDPRRNLVAANPDDSNAQHLGVVGDTYTILPSGMDTAGRFTLIDMHVEAPVIRMLDEFESNQVSPRMYCSSIGAACARKDSLRSAFDQTRANLVFS